MVLLVQQVNRGKHDDVRPRHHQPSAPRIHRIRHQQIIVNLPLQRRGELRRDEGVRPNVTCFHQLQLAAADNHCQHCTHARRHQQHPCQPALLLIQQVQPQQERQKANAAADLLPATFAEALFLRQDEEHTRQPFGNRRMDTREESNFEERYHLDFRSSQIFRQRLHERLMARA